MAKRGEFCSGGLVELAMRLVANGANPALAQRPGAAHQRRSWRFVKISPSSQLIANQAR